MEAIVLCGGQGRGKTTPHPDPWSRPHGPRRAGGGVGAVVRGGVQGSGKTTLYRDRWLETHVRVAMDLLRTRARERAFLELCLSTRQPFVVDATNPTPADRRRYVGP